MKYVIEYIYVSLVGIHPELMDIVVVDAESREHATAIGDGTGDFVLKEYLEQRDGVVTCNDIYDLRVNPLIQWSKSRLDVGKDLQSACEDDPGVAADQAARGESVPDGQEPPMHEICDLPPECVGDEHGWRG